MSEHGLATGIAELEPDLQAEWKRVASILQTAGLHASDAYPSIPSARRNPADGLARSIDHTLLKQSAGAADFRKLCAEAREWKTFSVCVPPNRVALAAAELADSGVKVCTVVGFPFGYETTEGKVADTLAAIRAGAHEIDMVLPVGAVKDDDIAAVFHDIQSVVRAAGGVLVKVILESSELASVEIVRAGAVACFAGAHFLKTSTGFAAGGASLDALRIMRAVAGPLRGVKASGGVRTREFALQCLSLGVDRIGASATGTILGVGEGHGGGY